MRAQVNDADYLNNRTVLYSTIHKTDKVEYYLSLNNGYEAVIFIFNGDAPELPDMTIPNLFGWVYNKTIFYNDTVIYFFQLENNIQDQLVQIGFLYEMLYG